MKKGGIELAIGPMFAGKTTWLINKLEKYKKNQKIIVRYFLDNRYSTDSIVTHDGKKADAIAVKNANDILDAFKKTPNATILGLDELQFFEPSISELFEKLKKENVTIFISGLNFDHNHNMWEATKSTIPIADKIYNFKAICFYCGKKNATITNRKGRRDERIVIGGSEMYESLCEEDYKKAITKISS